MESKAGGQVSIQAITVRFNTENEADRTAWEKVLAIQQKEHLSMNRAIILGLTEAHHPTAASVPPGELTKQIADGIMAELRPTLPSFIAGCVAGTALASPVSTNITAAPTRTANDLPVSMEPTINDDPQPDFSRSHANWGFLGG